MLLFLHLFLTPGLCKNIKTQLDPEWNEEQQQLLEAQITNRAKARKFTSQTIRRQKALEEKRREDEEKEHRYREEVLQERKLKQQDATERFQRAHLLSHQRRQNIIGQRKQTTQLDEALEQIHESFYLSTSPSSAVAKPTVSKGITDLSQNPPPHGETKKVCQYTSQLSAAKAYAKLMQEKSGVNLKNSRLRFQQELEETQRLLGEQQLNSLQEFQKEINQLNQTQSFSSLDSLENEEQNAVQTTSLKDYFASGKKEFCSLKSGHTNGWINDLDNSRTPISSPGIAINNGTEASTTNEYLSDKLHTFASQNTESKCLDSSSVSSAEIHQNAYSAKCCFNSNQHKVADHNSHSMQKHTTFIDSPGSSDDQSAHPAIIPCNAWSTPDPTPRDTMQPSGVKDRLKFEHQRPFAWVHPLKLPLATPIFLTLSQKSQMDCDRTKTDSVKDSHKIQPHQLTCVGTANTSIHPPFTLNQNTDISNETKDNQTSLNKDNFKVKIRHDSATTRASSQAAFHLSQPDSGTNMTEGKENEPVTCSSMSTSLLKTNKNSIQEKHVKILKGILKKVSKHGNGKTKSLLSASNVLGIHMASSIRDSVELIKMKEIEAGKNPTKKKLKWLDEIDQANHLKKGKDEATGEEVGSTTDVNSLGLINQIQLQSPNFQKNDNIVNVNSNVNKNKESKWNILNTDQMIPVNYDQSGHQFNETCEDITTAAPVISDTVSATLGINTTVSSDYHFTKQSCTATGTRSIDHKMNAKKNITEPEKSLRGKKNVKMVTRAHSAKVCSGMGGNFRKGTIIRPLSACEVIRSQGKVMVPHPPPKPATDSKLSQKTAVNYNSSCQSQMHHAHVMDVCSNTPVKILLLDKDSTEGAIISDLQPQVYSSSNRSVGITTFPSSYSVHSYETAGNESHSVNAAQPKNVYNGTKQDSVCRDKTVRLDSTPTYEQIALLWHGVRDALAQKNGTNGNSQNSVLPCNKGHTTNLQPHRPNVSHLTIDGGSLLNGTQSVSRVGLFSSPSGARRKHTMDSCSNGTKYRALLEQRRMMCSSSANKSDQIAQNIQMQPNHSVFDPIQAISVAQNAKKAVSESTEQFMLAENLVETSAMDTDILAAMDAVQTRQHAVLQNKVQQLGLSALSFEEQKLIQSLDRLNQRLKSIQDTVELCNGILQVPSSFIIPYGVSGPGSRQVQAICGTQKHYACITPDNYAYIQRKYSRNKTS